MHLYKHARIHQIFGANTDVGKTVLTTAFALQSAINGRKVRYLKPVSTGPRHLADDEFVKKHTNRRGSQVSVDCLFSFKEPVSPHLAIRLEKQVADMKMDNSVNVAISEYIHGKVHSVGDLTDVYIETAGGVHSPSLDGISQVDSYRPLRLPSILIGDSKLGGISSTISAYESLLLRGYSIDAVCLFEDTYYRNWEYLRSHFRESGIPVSAFPAPPPKLDEPEKTYQTTQAYYTNLIDGGYVKDLSRQLDLRHQDRIKELASMSKRTVASIWWPFVQHGLIEHPNDVTVIDSAHGDFFEVYNENTNSHRDSLRLMYDGSASWWTQAFGHGNPALALAAARAIGRYGHVIFPQATHLPALKLAERLLSKNGPGKDWASRVFYSDNGSTAMEIALKMALRAYCKRHGHNLKPSQKQKLGILGLKGSYHGDTIGAMDACHAGDGVYTCEWHSARGYWFDPPHISMRNGKSVVTLPEAISKESELTYKEVSAHSFQWLYDIEARLDTELSDIYRKYVTKKLCQIEAEEFRLAALVLEPLVMGAGGMIFVDPLFQRILVDTIRSRESLCVPDGSWRGLPTIFDEVFVGMYRTGWQSCISILGVKPDIAVYAKTLTGGVVPLAVTLASSSIFDAFLGETKGEALLHGHSYTAHPIGCEVANETLSLMDKIIHSKDWKDMQVAWHQCGRNIDKQNSLMWSFWDPMFISELSNLKAVKSVATLGTILAFKLEDTSSGYQSHSAEAKLKAISAAVVNERSFGVHFRTLGDVAYFMTSFNTPIQIVRELERKLILNLLD